jgi:hypothetical protein
MFGSFIILTSYQLLLGKSNQESDRWGLLHVCGRRKMHAGYADET